jgi:phenylacetate-CoA ligase
MEKKVSHERHLPSQRLRSFGSWECAAQALTHARHNPFVQRQLDRSGITAEQLAADPETWHRLAFVTKDDLLQDQRLSPPFGTRCQTPLEEIALIVETSGTTAVGKEVHFIRRDDYERTLRTWGVALQRMGISARDIVALTFPVGMSGGGVKHADAYAGIGAKVLRVANLPTRAKLDAFAYYNVTVLVATPFYVDRLGAVADESKMDLLKLKVRKIVVATQSVTREWIEATERKWAAKLYEWYGTATGVIAFTCEQGMLDASGGRGTLHWNPKFALNEVLGRTTGEWIEGAARGELVATPIVSAAEPLFRIRTRDEVGFRPPGSCACGSECPGLESGTIRRLGGMFKIKGVNVWPAQVEATLYRASGIRDYRVRLQLDGSGREIAKIDLLLDARAAEFELEELGRLLREQTGVGFEINARLASLHWLHETAGEAAKTRRWVDERKSSRG